MATCRRGNSNCLHQSKSLRHFAWYNGTIYFYSLELNIHGGFSFTYFCLRNNIADLQHKPVPAETSDLLVAVALAIAVSPSLNKHPSVPCKDFPEHRHSGHFVCADTDGWHHQGAKATRNLSQESTETHFDPSMPSSAWKTPALWCPLTLKVEGTMMEPQQVCEGDQDKAVDWILRSTRKSD